MYWLLYIYPYDKIRRQQNEETEKSDESDEEPEWVDNPIHISETNI